MSYYTIQVMIPTDDDIENEYPTKLKPWHTSDASVVKQNVLIQKAVKSFLRKVRVDMVLNKKQKT